MRWKRARRSDNVLDARGDGSSGLRLGGKGLSLGGVAAVVIIGLLLGQDPLTILDQLGGQLGQSAALGPAPGRTPPAQDQQAEFVRAVLGDTEDTWRELFQGAGRHYQEPTLVLFRHGVSSACGFASSAVGPFYCPGDRQVYLDLDFFRELEQRFAAAGDFAQAYVIAHEIGHHVQALLGVSAKIQVARQRGTRLEGDSGLRVRQELQADCLAGVWAHHAQRRLDWLEPGDLEEALTAASAIGDDRLHRQARGQVVPDSFTHGTSAQRVRWFKAGFETGQVGRCDTFQAARL
ncbi:MAG: KPN_02809 family neutral zinc metallopeptidase [Pseudomonas sp.]